MCLWQNFSWYYLMLLLLVILRTPTYRGPKNLMHLVYWPNHAWDSSWNLHWAERMCSEWQWEGAGLEWQYPLLDNCIISAQFPTEVSPLILPFPLAQPQRCHSERSASWRRPKNLRKMVSRYADARDSSLSLQWAERMCSEWQSGPKWWDVSENFQLNYRTTLFQTGLQWLIKSR